LCKCFVYDPLGAADDNVAFKVTGVFCLILNVVDSVNENKLQQSFLLVQLADYKRGILST
jgi:hypothetical protein